MNTIALIAITAGSAASTISGLIASAVKSWRVSRKVRSSSDGKGPKERYTLTVQKDGKEVAYRIESSTRQSAEDMIKGIIEGS